VRRTDLEKLRADLNANRGSQAQAHAAAAADRRGVPRAAEFPMLNARYDDEANVVTRHGAVHSAWRR
jgi:2-oxoisovalerate dehydrogenase E2 component (dihydrolipoyl transacylase)